MKKKKSRNAYFRAYRKKHLKKARLYNKLWMRAYRAKLKKHGHNNRQPRKMV